MFRQGDFVNVYFKLPKQKDERSHPAIIISDPETNELDDIVVCVMVTSSEQEDIFTFKLNNEMLFGNLNKTSQARCHLITYTSTERLEHITPSVRLKETALTGLIEYINEKVLHTENYNYYDDY